MEIFIINSNLELYQIFTKASLSSIILFINENTQLGYCFPLSGFEFASIRFSIISNLLIKIDLADSQ